MYDNMAPCDEMYGELSKLKKEYLIDIVLTKKVPWCTNISEQLKSYIEQSGPTIGSASSRKTTCDITPLKQELQVIKLELKAAKELTTEKERTISYQKEVTELLRTKNNIKSVRSEVIRIDNCGAAQANQNQNVANTTKNSHLLESTINNQAGPSGQHNSQDVSVPESEMETIVQNTKPKTMYLNALKKREQQKESAAAEDRHKNTEFSHTERDNNIDSTWKKVERKEDQPPSYEEQLKKWKQAHY